MNQSDYEISTDKERLNVPWLLEQLRAQYWAGWYTMPQLLKAIDHSVCFGVYKGQAQVGFARVVSDYAITSTLNDVFIEEPHRRIGLGKMLMDAVASHPSVAPTVCIIGSRDAQRFYDKWEFYKIDSEIEVMIRNPS